MEKILEAARWAPAAHNMQNFEIVVVDDKKSLAAISGIKRSPNLTFIRENYQQLSFSEDELRRKKVGILFIIGFTMRLGYPVAPINYIRVRRDLEDFTHHNGFKNKGLD